MILDTSARESAGADRATQPEPPELAPGVELMGEMPETGFQDRQWLVMPVLGVLVILALMRLPWLLESTWDAEQVQQQVFTLAFSAGDYGAAALAALQMLLLLIPVLGSMYFLYALGSPAVRFAYRWSAGRLAPERAHGGAG